MRRATTLARRFRNWNIPVATRHNLLGSAMGIVIQFPRHGRASTAAVSGRGTSEGQGASGQLSENQRITSSYFRAVKVLPSTSKRSKKRQSPAASRPTVANVTDRPSEYAKAQARKCELNSSSMVVEHSRNFPTTQEFFVGKFRLAESADLSDISAMATPDQVRHTLRLAMARKGEGPVTVALELGQERNYISDFLDGRKQSLKTEVTLALVKRYRIPLKDLLIA